MVFISAKEQALSRASAWYGTRQDEFQIFPNPIHQIFIAGITVCLVYPRTRCSVS